MADAITTKNITSVDEVQSVDNTDKVFVNDNGSFKQISVSNLMKQAPTGITEETDPTVPLWAKQPTKPSYTANEVGALPVGTKIPAKTSDLTNDSGYLTQIPEEYVTETELGQKGYITEDDIPEKLPSPGTLTFTGAVNDTYDGSTDKTINIPTGGGEGGTSDYNALANKPKLNGVEIVGNKTSADYKIVSSEQGAENNGKFLGVGADGNVVPVDKPTYTADEVGARPDTWTPSAEDVGALPNNTEIPSKTSDLENDSGFITNSDIPEKLPNPQKIIFTGAVSVEYDGSSQQTINIPAGGGSSGGTTNYNDLSNKPQIGDVTLEGKKTLDDIGAQPKGNYLTSVPQASSTIIGGIKAESAGAEDTVPVKIKSDGTLAVPTYVSNEQVKSAVNNYFTDHPESTVNIPDNSVVNAKLADKSVTPDKIYGMEVAVYQMFDPVDFMKNGVTGYINISNGQIVAGGNSLTEIYSGYCTSPYWEVEPDTSYSMNFQPYSFIAFYDSDKTFLSAHAVSTVVNNAQYQFTTIENAKYMRFCKNIDLSTGWLNDKVICQGEQLYDDYFVGKYWRWTNYYPGTLDGNILKRSSVHGEKLIDGTIPFSGINGVEVLEQIFDGDKFWDNNSAGYINLSGSVVGSGVGTENTMYKTSDYLNTKPNMTYTMNFTTYHSKVYFYDALKQFLSSASISDGQFTTPDETAYVRFTTTTTGNNIWNNKVATKNLMICEGDKLFTGFAPCGSQILIKNLQIDMSAEKNSVDGSVIADNSIPSSKLMPDSSSMKILCYGDSLTQNKYPEKVAEILNTSVVDAGVGGNTVAQIYSRIGNYGTDFDVITLMCGTNDNGGQTSCPLGSVDDEVATDGNATESSTTYASRLKRLINRIKEMHPGKQYIIMSPFDHAWGDMEVVADLMEQIAKLYSIPYLDIYHLCGWRGHDETDKSIYMQDDTHENDIGSQRIAELLSGFIKTIKAI